MAEHSELIGIEQLMAELEGSLEHLLFLRRLARISLFGGVPAIIAGIVAGNILIPFAGPGHGRVAMNALLGILLLVSGAAASAFWWDTRTNIGSTRTDLRKLRIRRDALIPAPDDPRQPHAFAFREYRQSVPALRDDYRRGAERYRRQHNWFQITVIVGSILTSVSTTAAADQAVWRWAAVVLSATVSISAGVISYFKFRERSMNLQQTADSIDLEIQAFALGIRRYKNIPAEQAAAEFAEEIERIKEEQRKKELQLEQPPEGQRGPSNGQGGASGA